MLSREETEKLFEELQNSRPKKLFKHFDKNDMGVLCVLKYLINVDRPVSAGEISQAVNVSTARMAVLIKKMEEKELIIKTADPCDARRTIIKISENGKLVFSNHRDSVFKLFSSVIDRVGVERFREFIEISGEISKAVEEELKIRSDF